MKRICAMVALPVALAGCATLPNATLSYYFPVMDIQYSITQSLTCDATETHLFTIVAVTAKAVPVADIDGGAQPFSFQSVGGQTVDSDLSFNLGNDGRLLGVNGSSTGEGGTIIKSVVGLAASIATIAPAAHGGAPAPASAAVPDTPDVAKQKKIKAACDVIATYGALFESSSSGKAAAGGAPAGAANAPSKTGDQAGKKAANNAGDQNAAAQSDKSAKVLTLTYSFNAKHVVESPTSIKVVDDNDPKATATDIGKNSITFPPDPNSVVPYALIHSQFDIMRFELGSVAGFVVAQQPVNALELPPQAKWDGADTDHFVPLKLNRVVLAMMQVAGPTGDMSSSTTIWTQKFSLPERGNPYPVPVPIGKTFGKNSFSLTLGDDGSIEKIGYTSASGMSDAMNGATQIASAAKKETAEQKAADVQGQSDLIYQQQRLIVCQAKPATCASK